MKKDNNKTNFKNKAKRLAIYNRTFMKQNLESRLFTLQQCATKLSLHTTNFALDMNQDNYEEFSEAIGDIETMIELAKHGIEPLANTSMLSKYNKLQNLKDRTDKIDIERIKENAKKSFEEKQNLDNELNKAKFDLSEAKLKEAIKHTKGGIVKEPTKEEKEKNEIGFQYIEHKKNILQKIMFWKK